MEKKELNKTHLIEKQIETNFITDIENLSNNLIKLRK